MNLKEFVNYVCTKAQMPEASDADACKLFLSKRYELIYNAYLWKDALTMVNVAFDAGSNADNAEGIVMLPTQIDRLVAVRTANNSVRIQGLEHYYRIDWDSFGTGGGSGFSPNEMSILNPIWLTSRPAVFINHQISVILAASYLPPSPRPAFYPSNTIIAQGLPAGLYRWTLGENDFGFAPSAASNPQAGDIQYATPVAGTLLFYTKSYITQPSGTVESTPLPMAGNVGATATIIISSDNSGDITGDKAVQIKVTWRDLADRYTVTGGLPLTLTPKDGSGFMEIESVFKPATQGTLSVTVNNPGTVSQVAGTLSASDLQSPSYQRIRIFPIPTSATTLNVLGKKPFVPMTFDTEVPAIRNLDNCLIAFAMHDMYVRARFPDNEAAPHLQEGAALLKELALLETIQAAHHSIIELDGGFGNGVHNPRAGFGRGNY